MSETTTTSKKNPVPDHIALLAHEITKLVVVDKVKSTSGDPESPIYQTLLPAGMSPNQVQEVRNFDKDFGLALKMSVGEIHIRNLADNQANSMKGTYNMLGGKEATVVTKRSTSYSATVGSTNPEDKVTYYGTTRVEYDSDMGSSTVVDGITATLRQLGKELLGNK